MAAKCFIDGTFFASVCSLVSITFHFTFHFVFFYFFMFHIIFITFACGFAKLISLVEKKGFSCTFGNLLLIGVSSLKKNVEND